MEHLQKKNAVLAQAINEGLSAMCSSAAPSVLYFLESNGSIRSKSSIEDPGSFSKGLESIFGFGSKIIEKRILEILCMKLQLPEQAEIPDRFKFEREVGRIFGLCKSNQLDNGERELEREAVC